jgi:UDP-3-O-[3-hydroxymyristoyl] glucosamine N-acyltransferase
VVRARLGELAALLGGELIGDTSAEVTRISGLEAADAHSITFLAQAALPGPAGHHGGGLCHRGTCDA